MRWPPCLKHYAAITDPKQVAQLLRATYTHTGHPYATAALKLAPMLFQRPGELRSMEWTEIDLEKAEQPSALAGAT